MLMDVEMEESEDVDLTKHPSGIIPTVQNVVATVNLGCRLDLKAIVLQARNAEYNPKRFGAVIMKIREPKTTALVFATGKMVCMGAKSEDDVRLAARKFARIIQKLGFRLRFTEFQIRNLVASCDVKFPIRLEGLAFYHNLFCTYEPELFPGLIYRYKITNSEDSSQFKGKKTDRKVCLLIFVSGKIVLTGAKSREEMYKAFEDLYPVIREFRKLPPRVNISEDEPNFHRSDFEQTTEHSEVPEFPVF